MNKTFAIIICRGIALFFILKGLNYLPDLLIGMQQIDPSEAKKVIKIYLFGNIFVPVLVGLFIFWKSGLVALTLTGSTKENAFLDDAGLVRAGSFILGVWLLIRGVNELVSYIVLRNYTEDPFSQLSNITEPVVLEKIVVIASSFILGILLILGCKFLSKIYIKLKNA